MKVAFVGPSIHPGNAVRASFPAITWQGPARQGDIARAVQDGATAIGLIDGLYGTLAAVWHKEILFALAEGVHVIGGASLGALRAAECWPFGMRGVGAVFNSYLCGERVDDGDVALLHAPAEMDFAPITETLVDLEATIARLVECNLVGDLDAQRIVDAAARTFFWSRTLEVVLTGAGYLSGEIESFIDLIEGNRVEQKRSDALSVLRHLKDIPDERGQRPTAWQPQDTRSFRSVTRS